MKAVILAGGLGTRLSEHTDVRPKPMVEVGGRPIIWHIMHIYAAAGITDFIVCAGYKSEAIHDYFANYALYNSDVTYHLDESGGFDVHQPAREKWRVTVVNTGLDTMTGGRIARIRDYVQDDTFCMTYGDGVSDVNISDLITRHKQWGRWATVTAVRPQGRWGGLNIQGCEVCEFQEKPAGDGMWVNGGFFVLEPMIFDYIENDSTVWEQGPLQDLVSEGNLAAYKHSGFWYAMDTLYDQKVLNEHWVNGAPWKVW